MRADMMEGATMPQQAAHNVGVTLVSSASPKAPARLSSVVTWSYINFEQGDAVGRT